MKKWYLCRDYHINKIEEDMYSLEPDENVYMLKGLISHLNLLLRKEIRNRDAHEGSYIEEGVSG